jgi:hypothetical protein
MEGSTENSRRDQRHGVIAHEQNCNTRKIFWFIGKFSNPISSYNFWNRYVLKGEEIRIGALIGRTFELQRNANTPLLARANRKVWRFTKDNVKKAAERKLDQPHDHPCHELAREICKVTSTRGGAADPAGRKLYFCRDLA